MLRLQERESLKYGDKVFLHYPGWGKNYKGRYYEGRYTRPLAVTKVTATQFTVEAEDEDGKPTRFMKSNGRKVGAGYTRSAPTVTLATAKAIKDVDKFNAERAAKENAKEAKDRTIEVSLREKYNAVSIVDESIQKEFLAPLREMAENGEQEMQNFLDTFEDVTIADENFYRVNDAVRRESENGYFSYGQTIRDNAMNLHEQLSQKAIAFAKGARYRCGKVEITKLDDLLYTVVRETLNQQLDRFFSGGCNSDITSGDQAFIAKLREIMKDQYAYDRIKVIEDGDELYVPIYDE